MIHEGKVAIVTGASSGIGYSVCQSILQTGTAVVAVAKQSDKLYEAVSQLQIQSNVPVLALAGNVTDWDFAPQIVKQTVQKFQRIDILVNNVGGIPATGQLLDLSPSDWQQCLDLNLTSAVNLCRHAIPELLKQDSSRIINISSVTAKQPGAFNPHYAAAKAGLLNFTKYLAGQYGPQGIRVNSITPGNIYTEGFQQFIQDKASQENRDYQEVHQEQISRVEATIPLGRLGLPQEIAQLVQFLLGSGGDYISGSDIVVDGGKLKGL